MSVLVENTDFTLKLVSHFNEVEETLFNNSSELINTHRKKAFQDFVLQGIPGRKNENYKYINLQPSFSFNYSFFHRKELINIDLHDVFKCDVPELDTHLYLMQNGWYYEQNNKNSRLPEGVIIDSLANISKTKPELFEKYYSLLAKTEEDPLVALNSAFVKDGYFLFIPKDVIIEKPIQIINLMNAAKDSYITQRNIIVAESGANAKLILCDHTLNPKRYLTNSVTEIYLSQNAHIEYYTIQNQHNASVNLNSVFIHQGKDSSIRTNTTSLHGGLIRNNMKVILDGENADAGIFGMAFMDHKQYVDNFTKIIHAKPHCLSNQVYKYVLDDQATGAFSGRIHVKRDAQKTNAFQKNNNLLLADSANMHTKPQLIIDADDVKCSHGATVGQIDEESLFYLRARGIGEKDAMLMMMNAFAYEVVQEIKVEPLRNRIDELIDRRLRGEVARCHDCAYDCEC